MSVLFTTEFLIQEVYEFAEKRSRPVGWSFVVDFLLEYRWAADIVRSISAHF